MRYNFITKPSVPFSDPSTCGYEARPLKIKNLEVVIAQNDDISTSIVSFIDIFYSYVSMPACTALICVHTYFEIWAFYSPHINWYMYAFLLHSSAASARLRAFSVYGSSTVGAFSNDTMTFYHLSSQSPRIIAIVVMITRAHSLPW